MVKGRIEGLIRREDPRQTSDIVEPKLDMLVPKKENTEERLEVLVEEARRLHHYRQDELSSIGKSMVRLLTEQVDQEVREIPDEHLLAIQFSHLVLNREKKVKSVAHGNIFSQPTTLVTREEADLECCTLDVAIYGTDGIALAEENRSLVDTNIIGRLTLWIQDASRGSQKLWIDFPFKFERDSRAMAAALSVISFAARANAPFLSYICRKPSQVELTGSQSSEDADLLSIVYSLILQLLRFRPQKDGFKFNLEKLTRLSENISSWNVALDLLRGLLDYTPVVRYCIIHGLNELETRDGHIRCNDLLEVLFSYCDRPDNPFSILFTTSGQSQVLRGVIDQEDQTSSGKSRQMMNKRGMHLSPMGI